MSRNEITGDKLVSKTLSEQGRANFDRIFGDVFGKKYPKPFKRSTRTGRIICKCGKGYGSDYDGICTKCRGRTAWEQQQLDTGKR